MNDHHDEMNDEKFDHWLHSAARDYNRPGDVPREAMWSAIKAATPIVDVPSASAGVSPVRGRGAARYWQAAAAVVILAAGVGIGRLWSTRGASAGDEPIVASVPADDAAARLAAADTATGLARRGDGFPSASTSRGDDASSMSYDLAAVQHLSRVEALLTSFKSSGDGGGPGESPASLDRWARDLLGDTRLLLDSPAASDARRRHLLEDLELVLAQIVQLPAESVADRTLVQRSIERGAMLSRLRSSIPAGFMSGT